MKKLLGFIDDVANQWQAVYTIAGAITVLSVGLAVVWRWMGHLNIAQIVLLAIAVVCLVIIGLTAFYLWWRKRNIASVPELLSKIDKMMLDYVDKAKLGLSDEKNNQLLDDMGELLDINFNQFRYAARSKDKTRINTQFQNIAKQYAHLMNALAPEKQTTESLTNLVLMGGIMDEYGVGLNNIKSTKQYQKVLKRIQSLQQIMPTAEASKKINDYFFWSDGLYCLLLSTKPIGSVCENRDLIPAKARAMSTVLRPLIENNTHTLIAAVRESISKSKET